MALRFMGWAWVGLFIVVWHFSRLVIVFSLAGMGWYAKDEYIDVMIGIRQWYIQSLVDSPW